MEKELCVSITWFKWKVTLRPGENETEMSFMLIRKKH